LWVWEVVCGAHFAQSGSRPPFSPINMAGVRVLLALLVALAAAQQEIVSVDWYGVTW
jgi:hypothetical protein